MENVLWRPLRFVCILCVHVHVHILAAFLPAFTCRTMKSPLSVCNQCCVDRLLLLFLYVMSVYVTVFDMFYILYYS